MLVIPLSQHYTATMIIVVLWRQTVKLYEKEVLCIIPQKCTYLRLSNDYDSLLKELVILSCSMRPNSPEMWQ